MRTRIITSEYILDLSGHKFSTQQENNKISEKVTTNFLYPFEIVVDDFVQNALGNFTSFIATELNTEVDCYFEHELKVHKAKFEILSITGNRIQGQVDYGYEEIPNFSKKLSEFELEKFTVDDIHTFAPTIFDKKYPETNFNFPRIYTTKYQDNEAFDAFDGYLNDSFDDAGTLKMRENYIDGGGNIFNINIIHPCPSFLYLLKFGFEDAGLQLKGDILTDEILQNAFVYSGTEYFRSKKQSRVHFSVESYDFQSESSLFQGFYFNYSQNKTIEKKGKYKIVGNVHIFKPLKRTAVDYKLIVNGAIIWQYRDDSKSTYEKDLFLNFDFNVNDDNTVVYFEASIAKNAAFFSLIDLDFVSDVLEDVLNEDLGGEYGAVENQNLVDLKYAVPDMTFGTLVTTAKNWFNYSIEFSESTVTMNNLNKEKVFNAKDFRKYEHRPPTRKFLKEKSFQIKFPEFDDHTFDSIFFSKEGLKTNADANDDTTVLEILGYPLPVKLPKTNGFLTANVLTDSNTTLQLVHYEGLVNGTNNATENNEWFFPNLFESRFRKWYSRRLSAVEFTWSFLISMSESVLYNINDYLFCYGNNHIIKTENKDKVDEDTYQIDIVTETIV